MATHSRSDIQNMALFCDFENVAIGVNEAKYAQFDIRKVLDRLLLKGDIVVKKAYCDWSRYQDFKSGMHNEAFELIEIPKKSQSGKNSADIRMVVDALDLCYTKSHVDAFVIISGDSDFSPLVSKLRENNKTVIGVGVRHSTAGLLVGNCDEFIFYDDLVKAEEAKRKSSMKKQVEAVAKKPAAQVTRKQKAQASRNAAQGNEKKSANEDLPVGDASEESRRLEAIELVIDTVEALLNEKDLDEVHASTVKNALKRRRPDFVESAYGYKAFGKILEDAEKRGLLVIHKQGQAVAVSLTR